MPDEAAGVAADDAAGDGDAPVLQAEARIAKAANGAAMRKDVFLVVKVRSPVVGDGDPETMLTR